MPGSAGGFHDEVLGGRLPCRAGFKPDQAFLLRRPQRLPQVCRHHPLLAGFQVEECAKQPSSL